MATSKKANLKEYIDTVSRIKPSAEVKFGSVQEDGSIDEISAREQYWESMTSDEVQEVADNLEQAVMESQSGKRQPTTGDLLNKIDQIAKDRPEPEIVREVRDVVKKVNELTETQVDEEWKELSGDSNEEPTPIVIEEGMEPVTPEQMVADEDNLGPVAGHYDELEDREERPEVSTDVSLILMALEKLIDKIDNMQNFTPVIHVPAPVIHVTLPETRRTVTKAIERDEAGYMKTVRETIEEVPQGEPLIEVVKEETEPTEPEDIVFEEGDEHIEEEAYAGVIDPLTKENKQGYKKSRKK